MAHVASFYSVTVRYVGDPNKEEWLRKLVYEMLQDKFDESQYDPVEAPLLYCTTDHEGGVHVSPYPLEPFVSSIRNITTRSKSGSKEGGAPLPPFLPTEWKFELVKGLMSFALPSPPNGMVPVSKMWVKHRISPSPPFPMSTPLILSSADVSAMATLAGDGAENID